ncbi:MAG: primosomal protein N' [Verrucomicrobia bacterium]|nr:primosomal protein N' [Verrucomicrobiota bacterium]
MTIHEHRYAQVAVDAAVGRQLDYAVPDELQDRLRVGSRVWVPLGKRKVQGTVTAFPDEPAYPKLKPIVGAIDSGFVIPASLLKLAHWISDYYMADLGATLKTVVPASVRKPAPPEKHVRVVRRAVTLDETRAACVERRRRAPKQAAVLDVLLNTTGEIVLTELCKRADASAAAVKALEKDGLVAVAEQRVDRDVSHGETFVRTEPKPLTCAQQAAYDGIVKQLDDGEARVNLLHGVTGSGKTEVYLQVMARVLERGKGAIVLVPEIALTPQTIERFKGRFGGQVAVLHHRLSGGERHDEWRRLFEGRARIAVGPRSAVFAPIDPLGLIVVDEEHETSYKQTDSAPRYHARDVAVVRAAFEGATVILGSATPSLESYWNAQRGKYTLFELPERVDSRPMPAVRVVDLGREKGPTVFSAELLNAIEDRLKKGEQTILFLNRRGYATTMKCRECNAVVECARCSVSLTYHKKRGDATARGLSRSSETAELVCHLCGYSQPVVSSCPKCGAGAMLYRGVGTQKVERMLYKVLVRPDARPTDGPAVRVLRMDSDTTTAKHSHAGILGEFRAGRADILVGTQMIAKGLDLPNVTLVGVIVADTALGLQDFRAAERTFQLITQVAGRAGRGEVPGEVVVQTYRPDSHAIRAAARHDFKAFYGEEIKNRRNPICSYPPHVHMVCVTLRGPDAKKVLSAAESLAAACEKVNEPGVEVLGPSEAPIARAQREHRMQLFLKSTRPSKMLALLRSACGKAEAFSSVKVTVDVDPVDLM